MENRKRNGQIIVRVTEGERVWVEEKMKQIPTMNLSAYSRKMLIDGYIIVLDLQEVKSHTAQLQKIGCFCNSRSLQNEGLGNFPRVCPAGEACEGTSKNGRRQTGILRERLSVPYACYETVNTDFKGKDGTALIIGAIPTNLKLLHLANPV